MKTLKTTALSVGLTFHQGQWDTGPGGIAVNFGQLVAELNLIVRDTYLRPNFLLNGSTTLCLSLRPILISRRFAKYSRSRSMSPLRPGSLTLPTTISKKLFRVANSNYEPIRVHERIEDIESLDLDHDQIGDHVTNVAIHDMGYGSKLCVYPKAAETDPF